MRNIFIFLLIPLLHGICDDENDIDQRELTLDADAEKNTDNNLLENLSDGVVLSSQDFDSRSEIKKVFLKPNYINYNDSDSDNSGERPLRKQKPKKERRSDPDPYKGIECYSCHGFRSSNAAVKCYSGGVMKTQKCSVSEQCYTEIHPRYIKRGCMLSSTLNRTFVCKCPLCNNKPSNDISYYSYLKYDDWQYDNRRLEQYVRGMNLICKFCDTKGSNATQDGKCKRGKDVDYMTCGTRQICYTNIDNEIDYVSRGCIDLPAYNSMFNFCNKSFCNIERIPNPHTKLLKYRFVKLTANNFAEQYHAYLGVLVIFLFVIFA